MSVKAFMQFILLIVITGGGYAYYMRDQIHFDFDKDDTKIISPLSPREGDDTLQDASSELRKEPKFDSGDKFMDFNKKAYYDIRTDLSNNKITEEDAKERIKVIKDRILRTNGIDPSIDFYKRSAEEKDKITNLLSDFDPDMSQRQQDIATDKAIDKASNYYNKIGLAAKIAAFFSPKDSQIGITAQKIQAENDKIQKNIEIRNQIRTIEESNEDEYTKTVRIGKLTKDAQDDVN
ncbi:hypothetical protein [Pseudaquidulcibacter saccharophilus]|uniref:hypothetical protein n=1 Tax=Pseudaquidulcibacter saccharophilus TaxID=2831900 RepID=UPI001EFF4466|nr:hypothetical protein [Pseudaquidulcibacter saccharophilus]